uniref:beta-glucosidase n=1 Tax=Heliothis virescens TaxID=7102 RepID=A0A2A4JUL2_HELVI
MAATIYFCHAILYLALSHRVSSSILNNEVDSKVCFKDGFVFGVATSAYQVEGAWNVSGKGESIWDRLTHEHPEDIFDHSNGDIADGCYYKVKEDVRLMKDLGISFYSFSAIVIIIFIYLILSKVNEDGIRYYNELIDELIHNNITPALTMYHWDLPQYLGEMGGWTNPLMADYFVDYARVLLDNFGSKVKLWMTFNEPLSFCRQYDPYGTKDYLCGHNVLRAHGMVYRMFEKEYRDKIGGEMSIVISFSWSEPHSDSKEDQTAAETDRQFGYGWFANPIFSEVGDYPAIMRSVVDENSKQQGFARSRLPYFTPQEVKMLRGSWDYLALNHYTTFMVKHRPKKNDSEPTYINDINVESYQKDDWPKTNSSWLKVVPWGFRKALNWIKLAYKNPKVLVTENGRSTQPGLSDIDRISYIDEYLRAMHSAMYEDGCNVVPWGFRKALNWIKLAYKNPKVLVTENGRSTQPGLSDIDRISYIDEYLRAMHSAMYEDGCNVIGYTYWSFLDNFEWSRGYSERFGLIEVDYKSPNLTRTPRQSAKYFTNVAKTGCLPDNLADYIE